ncbi:MAG TPA: hypothetical protein VHE81_18655 [Lacipirellulaceae bacterium]|nr:hypothetical protein [Lacipirellulaceae bacterium]
MDTTDAGFVQHWQTVGPLLEQFERDEMRRYTNAQRQRDIAALLALAAQFATPRFDSGFVEQQRLFKSAIK